jgi:hypothetical protein
VVVMESSTWSRGAPGKFYVSCTTSERPAPGWGPATRWGGEGGKGGRTYRSRPHHPVSRHRSRAHAHPCSLQRKAVQCKVCSATDGRVPRQHYEVGPGQATPVPGGGRMTIKLWLLTSI